jgi:hypothetical protein
LICDDGSDIGKPEVSLAEGQSFARAAFRGAFRKVAGTAACRDRGQARMMAADRPAAMTAPRGLPVSRRNR